MKPCTNQMAPARHPAFQHGNTLIVVIVLLLLATLFVLFSVTVGRFEQRTSANDLRSKLVHETAESGLSLGVELLNADKSIFATNDAWRLCDSDDFPCGAVPEGRRANMYAYRRIGTTGDTLADRLLPLQDDLRISAAGGYDAERQVGAVLCRLSAVSMTNNVPDCTTDLDDASSTWVVTVVSRGVLDDEGSSATVTQTIGAYNIFSVGMNIPPLVASGSVAVGGGLQIVAAADGAGPGVPVSVWSRLDVGANGTPNTCHFDEFFRQGGSSAGPAYYDGIAVCHTCNCPTERSLSFGKGGLLCEGMDIVDIEENPLNDASCPNTANLNIHRDEFPRDLFAFLFGQTAWLDLEEGNGTCAWNDYDCHFGETRAQEAACTFQDAQGVEQTVSVPADTCYLLNIRNKIHIGDGYNDEEECKQLQLNKMPDGVAQLKGLVWMHGTSAPLGSSGMNGFDCDIKNVNELGKPSAPIALVYDGALTQVHFKLYGLLFVREPNNNTKLIPEDGGTAALGMNGGAVIYGAAVVQGKVSSGGGGTAAIVYNRDVLFNLINDPDNMSPTSLPGSWTDRLRY